MSSAPSRTTRKLSFLFRKPQYRRSTSEPPSSESDGSEDSGTSSTQSSSASSPNSEFVHHTYAADGLPSYHTATVPTHPVTYEFTQDAPFAMTVARDGDGPLYWISVGVNVWMPSSSVTFVRRSPREDAPIVARLEMGIATELATLTMGEQILPLHQVLYSTSSSSSYRYQTIGADRIVKWKLGPSWEAHLGSTLIAQYTPSTWSQKLTLQPQGHPIFDHIIIGLLILMREHLTPKRAQVGDAAGLFSYQSYRAAED